MLSVAEKQATWTGGKCKRFERGVRNCAFWSWCNQEFWWRVHATAREADPKLSWIVALGKSYLLCSPLHQATQRSVAQTELPACSDERVCWPSDNCSLRGRERSINQNESSAPGLCLTWHGSNPPHQPKAGPEEAKGPGELREMISFSLVLYQPWWINSTLLPEGLSTLLLCDVSNNYSLFTRNLLGQGAISGKWQILCGFDEQWTNFQWGLIIRYKNTFVTSVCRPQGVTFCSKQEKRHRGWFVTGVTIHYIS